MKRGPILAVYTAVSQVDEPVFVALANADGGRDVHVIYWNEGGLRRLQPDPELGLTPVFPEIAGDNPNLRRQWLDSREHGLADLHRTIVERAPRLVILNDLPGRAKLQLALRLRSNGVKVAFRSDKNQLSERAGRGLRYLVERWIYRLAFDVFCPTSRLAQAYYRWPSGRNCILFPYATDLAKFSPKDRRVGLDVRLRLGIPSAVPVLLCVAKFVDREGPRAVIDAYFELRTRIDEAWLILVGSGPDFVPLQKRIAEHPKGDQVRAVGYVPFADLQDYFFAADIFLHLAKSEPWGVSVSDALVSGLTVLTTDRVGAGLELLTGDLERYVIPVGDTASAAAALEALARAPSKAFAGARERVEADYSTIAAARRLAAFGG